jgi:hypothetical protein
MFNLINIALLHQKLHCIIIKIKFIVNLTYAPYSPLLYEN